MPFEFCLLQNVTNINNTMKPFLRGHPDERPTPLLRPHDYVNQNINVLISTPDERPTPLQRPHDYVNQNINVLIPTTDEKPPLLKGHISCAKGVTSQEG